MPVTHAWSMNGNGWTELTDTFGSPTEEVCHLLSRLNGKDKYSLIIWRLPKGEELDEVSLDNEPQDFIQAAGSADKMTVEVRRINGNQIEHCIVGRKMLGTYKPDKEIVWSDFSTFVQENEVFACAEACAVFTDYYKHNWLSVADYSLRSR